MSKHLMLYGNKNSSFIYREGKEVFIQYKDLKVSLSPVGCRELLYLRTDKKKLFVFKYKNTLFYSKINKSNSKAFTHLPLSQHCCAHKGEICNMVRGTTCHKIMDRFIDKEKAFSIDILDNSKRIEKYPFILLGYELYNPVDHIGDRFIVLSCTNMCYD